MDCWHSPGNRDCKLSCPPCTRERRWLPRITAWLLRVSVIHGSLHTILNMRGILPEHSSSGVCYLRPRKEISVESISAPLMNLTSTASATVPSMCVVSSLTEILCVAGFGQTPTSSEWRSRPRPSGLAFGTFVINCDRSPAGCDLRRTLHLLLMVFSNPLLSGRLQRRDRRPQTISPTRLNRPVMVRRMLWHQHPTDR